MSESALTSLAILKVNWDESGRDYVDSFIPFIVECIRRMPDDAISLPALQNQLKCDFSLSLPVNPLRMVLVRTCKRGYLRKENGVFFRIPHKCVDTSFDEKCRKIEVIHDSILHDISVYAKDQHDQKWSEKDASSALHEFLRENSLSLLFTLTEHNDYVGPRDRSTTDFIVGSFIEYAQRTDQPIIEDISALLKGNLLANALYLPDPGKAQQRFRNTRVYLDTTIIVYAAGYAGPARGAPCQEVVSLLKQYGAELFCFQQTRDEVYGILDACAARLREGHLRDSYGPSMEYFIERDGTHCF